MTRILSSAADIAVVGGGPAGLSGALAIASAGRRVIVVAPEIGPHAKPRPGDTRTTAILGDGIDFLRNIGVWSTLETTGAPLVGIRLIDDRGGLLRAPEVLFKAVEIERTSFGTNIPNAHLVAALLEAARAHPLVELVETAGVTRAELTAESARLILQEDAEIAVKCAVAADGRRSRLRAVAGIGTRNWSYPQTALALNFSHAAPHHGISTEFHRTAGPLTTVPLPDGPQGPCSSLVWVETPEVAQRLMALTDNAFIAALEARLGGLLGRIGSIGPRGAFEIGGMMATVAGKGRVALIGEAAHVLPPIGAQGLNLGLRDAAALSAAIADTEGDPGAPAVIEAYARARASDLVSREIGIDLLNRALLSNMLPLQMLRGLGLHALANSAHLRRAAIMAGLFAPGVVPPLRR